jgi:hypothetical protein
MADDDWRRAVKRVWVIADGAETFDFDAVIRESHTSELEVTENPVETGVSVSDHAFMRPLRLDIEACVGDAWVHGQDDKGNKVKDLFSSDAGSRAFIAFKRLQDLQSAAEPFTVQTGLRLYENMVITSLSVPQDAATASSLCFQASLREVIRVSTQTVTYPPRAAGKANRQASKKVSGGEKTGQPVTDAPKAQSILKSIFAPDSKVDLKAMAKQMIGIDPGGT